MLTFGLSAQGDYASLWKIVEKAQEKDQPKTALSAVKKIETKAEKEKHYGHLFAALFTEKNLLQEISRDSIVLWRSAWRQSIRNFQKQLQ